MKIFLIISAFVVGLAVLSIAVFLWSANRRHGEVGDVAHSLQRDFPAGTPIASLPDRALNLAASDFTLFSLGKSLGGTTEILASADRSFEDMKADGPEAKARSQKDFQEKYETFKKILGETPSGTVVVAFPVFMNARWLLDVKFEDGKVTGTETRYLD